MRLQAGITVFIAWSVALLVPLGGFCAETSEEAQNGATKTGWSNTTDLGLSSTTGNSDTDGINLDSLLEWKSERAGFRLKVSVLRTNTADDPYFQVDPGFTWEPGAEPPADLTATRIDPPRDPDTEQYLIDARYERSIRAKPRLQPGTMSWHIGTSWDRNLDAGILSRWMVYSGVGHVWWDRDDLKFHSTYSLSWTVRDEDPQDPEKEDEFPGLRYSWTYENQWSKLVRFHQDWTLNTNLSDLADFSSAMSSSIRIPMTSRLSLRVSLQWLYNNRPALDDFDLVALAILVDPDGVPGSGDETFVTIDSGGIAVDLGTVQARKDKLDTVFTTSLGISF